MAYVLVSCNLNYRWSLLGLLWLARRSDRKPRLRRAKDLRCAGIQEDTEYVAMKFSLHSTSNLIFLPCV